MISHRDRLQACLQGCMLDRPPVAFWRHFPVDDQSAVMLARATIHWQQVYDFDFVKVTPASSFCLKDWGADDVWEGNIEGTRRYTNRVVNKPQDWGRLTDLDPSAKHLSQQLECLKMIRQSLNSETPVIQTIFNPLAQAKNLVGNDTLISHMRLFPDALMKGLEIIARTTRRFIDALYDSGIDGIFYAVQHAQSSLLASTEYQTFGLSFDSKICESAEGFWLNLLHLHGRNIHFSLLSKLPFPIINWHDQETEPDIIHARELFRGVICGGLKQDTLVYRGPKEIQEEARDAVNTTGREHIILSTGCVVPVIAPHGNLLAARKSVEE